MNKLPAKYQNIVMPLILATIMTCVISLVSTSLNLGFGAHFIGKWMKAWAFSWLIAFPTLLMVLPVARKVTSLLVESPK